MTLVHLLPSVDINARQLLPDHSGVYYVTSGLEVIYVGKAKNLYNRWNSSRYHHKLEELKKYKNLRIYYRKVPLWAYSHVEAKEIRKFKPKLNKRYEIENPLLSLLDNICGLIVGIAGFTIVLSLLIALL